jgi:riboflavin synthase
MFTGIVECLAVVQRITDDGTGRTLELLSSFALDVKPGDSIAVNGACLTVVQCNEHSCSFQAGPETLLRTNLGELHPGDRVNLERSLKVGDRLSGHIVQGHVDAIGHIDARVAKGEWETIWFRCPEEQALQMVSKGSVAVDGISLTLVDVDKSRFSVALIPHTLASTTLGFKPVGATVNLETDIIAKHVCKYAEHFNAQFVHAK